MQAGAIVEIKRKYKVRQDILRSDNAPSQHSKALFTPHLAHRSQLG